MAGAGAADLDCCGLLALAGAAPRGRAHRFAGAGHRCISFRLGYLGLAGGAAGLLATWAGAAFHIDWLRYADPVAAIFVSLMILRITTQLTREAVGVLMDQIPAETRMRVIREAEQVPGVLAVEQARVRRSGPNYFADLTLALPRSYTFEHTGELVRAATDAVHRALPTADVVIHTVPAPGQGREHLRPRASGGRKQQCRRARSQRAVAPRQAARGAARGA